MSYERTAIHDAVLSGQPVPCRVIDAHAHVRSRSTSTAGFFPYAEAEGMLAAMDGFGIDQACISLVGAGDLNSRTIDMASRHPDRFLGFLLVNPRYPDEMLTVLEAGFRNPAIRGIGELHPTSYVHDYPVTGPNYEPAWQFAEERSLPVLIHSGPTSESRRCRPADIGLVAAAHPRMNVLIGHTGGYDSWDMLDEAIETARTHHNVFLEICAMGRHPGVLEYIVRRAGEDKAVFGTDAPFHDWHAEVAHVAFARIPDRVKEKVFGQTMADLLDMRKAAA